MSAILDLARQLGQALAASQEYAALQKAKAEVDKNLAAQYMLRDFRTRQYEVEKAKLTGAFKPEMVTELEEKAQIVAANPVVRDYLTAEAAFGQLMLEVQRLLGEAVGIDLDQAADKGGQA